MGHRRANILHMSCLIVHLAAHRIWIWICICIPRRHYRTSPAGFAVVSWRCETERAKVRVELVADRRKGLVFLRLCLCLGFDVESCNVAENLAEAVEFGDCSGERAVWL